MAYDAFVRFEWDEEMNESNFRKHEIWFEEAKTIWADPTSHEFFDSEHSASEDRFLRVGYSTSDKILLVVFCEKDGSDMIRIISVRKATSKERRQYEEGI